jgi:cytochrome c-type biogenesis protein CcmF
VTLLAYNPATQTATIRVFINPLVMWIWAGGAIVALGALFAIWPDRRRTALEATLAAA